MTIAELKHYANLFQNTQKGAWLQDIDWTSNFVAIIDGPGLGSRWLGNIVLIDPMDDNQQFGTYIHQLRHSWQRKQQGFLKYYFMNLLRKNQPDAQQRGVQAQLWLGDQKCRQIKESWQNSKEQAK